MANKQVTVKKGTKIVVGYRSLIDWYKTGNWAGWAPKNRPLDKTPTKWLGTGPQAIPGKGAKLPGAKGAAWNVQDFDVPKPDSRKHVDIKDNLGSYIPQWVYMMAEHLQYDSQGYSPSSLKNLKNVQESSLGRKDIQVGQEIAWKALPKGTTGVDLTYAKTYGEATLKHMGDKDGIPQLFGFLRETIEEKFKDSKDTLKDIYKGTSWEYKEGVTYGEHYGGQTGQEKLAEVVGAGTAEDEPKYGGRDVHKMLQRRPDPSSRRRGSNPVDITFKKSVKIKGKDLKFKRADVTTASYSSSKGHHGIGPKKSRVDDLNKSIKSREKSIKSDNNSRIKEFNKMIVSLHSMYGTSDALDLREKIAEERLGKAKWTLDKDYFSPPPTTDAELKKRIAAIDTKTKANFDKELAQALGLEVNGAFRDTIEWVLHSLGNVVVGEPYWANVMAIDMPNGETGTLILRYSFQDNGEFNKLKVADVFILDYSVERFIFHQGMTEKSEIAFKEALERANAAIITEGFTMISTEGNLMRQIGDSTRIRQTAQIAMPVEGEFAERMDEWTFALIDSIIDDAEIQMNKDFLSQATKFSKKMRADSDLGKIKSWMEAISEAFLGVSASVNQINLDFLWSAPYIASVEKQAGGGGAGQFEGSF